MAQCPYMQRCRESPILSAVLQHEDGRALLLYRYKSMLTTDTIQLQQRLEELAGCKKLLTQQQEHFEVALEKYQAEYRQKVECNLALSRQVAWRDHELNVCGRYRMGIEEFVQSLKDMLGKVMEAVDTNGVEEVVLRANAPMILYALYADLCHEVSRHRVQKE